jgi:hypothetical protein
MNKKDRYMVENIQSEDLHSNTKKNFDGVIDRGIFQKITWDQIELIDHKEVKANENLFKVYAAIQDLKGITLRLSFDALKIKNKWFLFQGIRVEHCVVAKNNCPAGI